MARRIIIVGFGSVGQAVIPLLKKAYPFHAIVAIDQTVDEQRLLLAQKTQIELIACRIVEANFEAFLSPFVSEGCFLLNLASSVSSRSLIMLTQRAGALYLDAGIEPWEYGSLTSPDQISNYALREEILSMKRESIYRATAIVAHGANPGFVSVLVKKAMISLAACSHSCEWNGIVPTSQSEWAELASTLDLRVIQIVEYDTQYQESPGHELDFVNTWSVPGYIEECLQNAEIGWGSHELELPPAARKHAQGSQASILLAQRGCDARVKSWSPMQGEFEAYLFSHNESISLADYLTISKSNNVKYRPTVHFAYRPSEVTVVATERLKQSGRTAFAGERVMKDEIANGVDELGVLLMTGNKRSVWFGSALSIHRARSLAPYNNATSLQVASSIVGAMQWAVEHPDSGIVESEEIDHADLFDFTREYWEPLIEVFTDWLPEKTSTGLQFNEFFVDTHSVAN